MIHKKVLLSLSFAVCCLGISNTTYASSGPGPFFSGCISTMNPDAQGPEFLAACDQLKGIIKATIQDASNDQEAVDTIKNALDWFPYEDRFLEEPLLFHNCFISKFPYEQQESKLDTKQLPSKRKRKKGKFRKLLAKLKKLKRVERIKMIRDVLEKRYRKYDDQFVQNHQFD